MIANVAAKPAPKPDAKDAPKPDDKPTPRADDNKPAPRADDKPAPRSDNKPAPKADVESKPDANTPVDTRYVLTSAQRIDRQPPGTGGSELAKKTTSASYRLEGIESQFSPFVNTKVEISGEVKPLSGGGAPPTLLVEFVQKLEPRC